MTNLRDDFIFGAATAAYQTEGATHEDGRTDSIWDTYCRIPGNIDNGESGEYADDSYHRWKEDISLLKELGVNAYRFSLSVPRIIPTPDGRINQKGIDHYRLIIDALLEAGIKPYLTLYHWDLPQYLEDRGGWMNRDIPYILADYASAAAQAFGDTVYCWTTLNEPQCSALLGYYNGVHAPGRMMGAQALTAVHHHNLAHGLMSQAIHAAIGSTARCSVTLNLHRYKGDPEACILLQAMDNELWLHPILRGGYAQATLDASSPIFDWSCIRDGDAEIIRQPIDCLGINWYTSDTVAMKQHKVPLDLMNSEGFPACDNVVFENVQGPKTDMGWIIDPQSFTDLLVDIHRNYPGIPLVITENGAAVSDEISADGATHAIRVHDTARIDYLKQHFAAVQHAMDAGADIRGYFVWSLLDNFEWGCGYSKRFGLVRVDYDTFARIPKDSFHWYASMIARHILID